MTNLIYVIFSCGSIDEARRISRYLVEQHWVACASIIPWVESYYLWDDALQNHQETKVLLKSSLEHFEKIKRAIIDNSTYEEPEIVGFSPSHASETFELWVKAQCGLGENRK